MRRVAPALRGARYHPCSRGLRTPPPTRCGVRRRSHARRQTPHSGRLGVCHPPSHFPGKTREHRGGGRRGARGAGPRSPARSESALYSEPARLTAKDGRLMWRRDGRTAAGAAGPGVVGAAARTRLLGGPCLPGLAHSLPRGSCTEKGPSGWWNLRVQVQTLPDRALGCTPSPPGASMPPTPKWE